MGSNRERVTEIITHFDGSNNIFADYRKYQGKFEIRLDEQIDSKIYRQEIVYIIYVQKDEYVIIVLYFNRVQFNLDNQICTYRLLVTYIYIVRQIENDLYKKL